MTELSLYKPPQQLDAGTPGEQDGEESLDKAVAISQPISLLINSVSLSDESAEDLIPAERTTQAKMQSVFQQVRKQVKSQVGMNIPRNGILELVQMVKSRELEMAKVNGPKNTEKAGAEILEDKRTGEVDVKREELIAVFQHELEASNEALRDEFKEQITQLQIEMQAYTDQALKSLESKVQANRQTYSHNILQRMYQAEQSETRSLEKKKKSPAPLLGSGKTRVLSRTMTTLTPKTCPPIVLGPRSKSETLSSSRDNSSLPHFKDPHFHVLSFRSPKYHQSCGPLPLPAPHVTIAKKPRRTNVTFS